MSYDLMVFDPDAAPKERDAFLDWYRALTNWDEVRDYSAITGATGRLPEFYWAIRQVFPPMEGPDAPSFNTPAVDQRGFFARLFGRPNGPRWTEDSLELTGYSIAEHAIYMTFTRSLADAAHEAVFMNALKCEVGFFDVSATDGVILYEPGDFDKLLGM